MEYLCLSCGKDRNILHFKSWVADKVKARRCDDCLNDPNVEERKKQSQENERIKKEVLSAKKTPLLEGYAQTPTAEKQREIKRRFDDLAEKRLLRELVGDNEI